MKDISGVELNIGDKIATQYQQLFRIGEIVGFTAKKVIVVFDFGAIKPSLEEAKLNPWRLAKVANQQIGLRDYFQYIQP
ncbi:MAG: hypothetical protein IJ880_03230 [Bacilli bacterium]|nr:hypothetical protein [Bacilli bacterium]